MYEFPEDERSIKKQNNKNRIEIEELQNDKANYIILGSEFAGKTTLLKYLFIKSRDIDKIPFYIQFDELQHDGKKLLYKILKNINDKSINIELEFELINGNCLILIDDIDESSRYFNHVKEFMDDYPNNKFIFTERENKYEKIIDIEKTFIKDDEKEEVLKKIYMHSFGLFELRSMVCKWFCESDIDEYNIFKNMSDIILTNRLPRTPLIYSLFLGIMEEDNSFKPTSISSLFDKFADIYLGKINLFPNLETNFNFQLKSVFLEELAKNMVDNNLKSISFDEYLEFVEEFGKSKRTVNANLLLEDLKNSNFIINNDKKIQFSYTCFMFFFYAKYCMRNSSQEKELINNIDISKFTNIIIFYSGLLGNSDIILESCAVSLLEKQDIDPEKISTYIEKYYSNNKEFKHFNFEGNEKNEEDINNELNAQEESYSYLESAIKRAPDIDLSNNKINVLGALNLLGNVLKNSEFVKPSLRKEALEYCLKYSVWVISELLQCTEQYIKKEKDGKKLEERLDDFITFMTLFVQAIISQIIGTTMLEDELKQLYLESDNAIYEFIICMIMADLNMKGYLIYLSQLVSKIKNSILLDCVKIKLESIYTERNFYDNKSDETTILRMLREMSTDIAFSNEKNQTHNISKENNVDMKVTRYINNLKKTKSLYVSRLK